MNSLRKQIDNLRKENQVLQEKLESFNVPNVLLKKLFEIIVRVPYRRVFNKKYKQLHKYDINYQNKTFTPYQLSYKSNPDNNAPVVIHLINNFKTGGASRIVVDIAEHLSEKYKHIVITQYNPTPQNYEGITVEEYPKVLTNKQIRKIIQKYNPSIVHIHWGTKWNINTSSWNWYYPFCNFLNRTEIKIIQNINIPVIPFFFNKNKCKYIFVSNYVKDLFSFLNEDNSVIYPGSDYQLFNQDYYQENESKNIGMVYRLDDHKLKKESIEPFIAAVKLDTDINVHIVGDGKLKPHFIKRINEEKLKNKFTLYNYISYTDLPNFYKKLTLFIAPVFEESFGQVTPFAMNMGIPILGYNTNAINEIIQDETCLVKTGDFESLSNLIVEKINDKEFLKKKSVFNKTKAQKFSLPKMIEQYQKIYN
ncbi:MAG: glycosyltransferase family 4 protein [Vicingaceae bacterium]|nr:glycosyltransferase family 4 protein [Vicingaceae bacterium]